MVNLLALKALVGLLVLVILSILFMMSFVSLAVASALYPVLTRYRLRVEEEIDPNQVIGSTVSILARYILILLLPVSMIAAMNSGIILNVPIWLFLLVAILVPTLDLCITGTLVSAFSMYAKNKSFILPVLLFPILLPIASPIISMNVKLLQGLLFADILMEFFFLVFHVILMFSLLILVSDMLLTE